MRRPERSAGDALLAADPAAARHLRRASVLALPAAVLVVVQAFALARLVVELAQGGRFDGLAGGVLVAAATARGLLGWWLERSGRRAAADAIGRLRGRLVGQAATLSATAPGALRPGEIAADAVHQLPAIEAYLGRFLSGRPAAAATTVVVLLAVASTDLLSAALLAPTVPLLIVFLWLVGTEARTAAEARLASLQLLGAHLLDVLRGLTDLRAFGRTGHQRGQVDAAAANYRRETMETLRAAFLSGLVLELVAMLGTALVAVIGGVRLAGGSAELAAILPALVLAPELYAPLRRLGAGYHDAADARAALDRLAAVEALAAAAPLAGAPGGPASPTPAGRTIVLDRVTVGGGADRATRLSEVSLTLVPGETLALVGPSGAGKSTLAALLLGLARPDDGAVLAEDRTGGESRGVLAGAGQDAAGSPGPSLVDLSTVDLTPWRTACAWVAQEPVLLPASLRENARLSAPGASDDEILTALEAAGLGALVAALPAGLDTLLGDGAALLSSGELRRLALARASLTDAELLVLDEPTAQLDALTADRLQRTIDRLSAGRTTVLITHDPALARGADRIAHLAEGTLVSIEPGRPTRHRTEAFGGVPRADARARSVAGAPSAAGSVAAGLSTAGSVAGAATGQPARGAASTTPASRTSLRVALSLLRPGRRDPVRRLVRRAIGLGALSALSGVAVLAISGGLIVQASTRPPVLELTSIIVLVRLFSILRATTRYGERLTGHDAALRILQRVRVQVFTHLASASVDGTGERTAEALDRAVGDVDRTADLLIRVLVPAVATVATGVVAVLVVAVFSPVAALAIGLVAGLGGGMVAIVGRRAGDRAARAQAGRGRLAAEVATSLDAGTELLLAGRTGDQRTAVARHSATVEAGAAADGARAAAISAAIAVLAAAAAVLVAALLAAEMEAGVVSGAIAAALVLAALATVERLDGIADAALAVGPATAAVARLRSAIEHRDDAVVDRRGVEGPATAAPGPAGQALVAADLRLTRGGRQILDGATLAIGAGERVALTGESGAGKSSLLLALAGLLPVEARTVHASGAVMAAGTAKGRSSSGAPGVLLVPSHPHLFGGSVAANLRLAAPDATDADLKGALAAVGLGPWLRTLPHGLDTMLGEGGATASGGQRQRIGLARAVLSPAPVLLLDEPASHLPEADARRALRAALDARPGRAALVVSHRAGERALASRELRLEGGRLSTVAPVEVRRGRALAAV